MSTQMFCIEYQSCRGIKKSVVKRRDGSNFMCLLLTDVCEGSVNCLGMPAVTLSSEKEFSLPCCTPHTAIVVLSLVIWKQQLPWTGVSGCYAFLGNAGDVR